jgi:hypothetical protein
MCLLFALELAEIRESSGGVDEWIGRASAVESRMKSRSPTIMDSAGLSASIMAVSWIHPCESTRLSQAFAFVQEIALMTEVIVGIVSCLERQPDGTSASLVQSNPRGKKCTNSHLCFELNTIAIRETPIHLPRVGKRLDAVNGAPLELSGVICRRSNLRLIPIK